MELKDIVYKYQDYERKCRIKSYNKQIFNERAYIEMLKNRNKG